MIALLCLACFMFGCALGGFATLRRMRRHVQVTASMMFAVGFDWGRARQFENALEAWAAFEKVRHGVVARREDGEEDEP